MADNKNEITTFSGGLIVKLDEVHEALPKGFNKARFVQNALALMNSKPELSKYNREQVYGGLLKGAFLGLDFFNGECHLVAYGNQLNFQKDYKGVSKLIKKYSIEPAKDVRAFLIREGDVFNTKNINGVESFEFEPLPLNDGAIKGAFAYVLFDDGSTKIDTMTLAELENTRKKSKMPNGGAWKDFTGEMYKKTVIHRLSKNVPLEFENSQQKELFIEDMAIETDVQKQVENEIELEANKEEFIVVSEDGEVENAPFMQE